MKVLLRVLKICIWTCCALFLICGTLIFAGARICTTPSVPVGLYWTTDAPIARGEFVYFCPPLTPIFEEARKRGYVDFGGCSGGIDYLFKQVWGMPGDEVLITESGVFVNGQILPASKPLTRDPSGRELKRYQPESFVLGKDELLVMTDSNPRSFDGRYFGAIPIQQVRSVVRPIFTWR